MAGESPQSPYSARQSRLALALKDARLEAMALNPGASLFYLTGLNFHLSERPVVFIFPLEHDPIAILPELEAGKLDLLDFTISAHPYGEDPNTWKQVFRQAITTAGLEGAAIGLEPRQLRVLELRLLESATPAAHFQPSEKALASLRIHKDATEIAAMQQAVVIAQRALHDTLPLIKIGMSERQLAAELTLQLLRNGSHPEMPFSPIVSSGPNGANPHATPTDRQLSPGDLLVLDWGASYLGYTSDLTRTFTLGEPSPELVRVAEIVKEANRVARATAAPGVTAGDVDRAARSVIEAAGYGDYFIHRTGHGLGLEGHEEPYIFTGNPLPLEIGMTFTIEPGIYLPKRAGVRIEDNLVITPTGGETLSDLPRELLVIGDQ